MTYINWQARSLLTLAFALLLTLGAVVVPEASRAQETPAAEEEESPSSSGPYAELRKSKERSTQLLVDRYYALVRVQEWTDASGKKVMAKYKSHDPNLQWVMLEVARGRGADRTVKEYKFPVAKLGKTSQSRVKQIDAVTKRLDEELAKPADDGTTGDAGAPMVDEAGEEPRTRRGRDRTVEATDSTAAEATTTPVEQPATEEPAAVEEPFDPDPLGFGEMDLGTGDIPPEAGASIPPTGPRPAA